MSNLNERIDDLQIKGYKIIQNPDDFCFGVDSVLLSDYAKVKHSDTVIDLCSGNGIVPLLLNAKYCPKAIHGIEIQEQSAHLAKRNAELNGLSDKIDIVCGDIKKISDYYDKNIFDVVTCNPPYKKINSGIINKSETKNIARHEILCTLEDVLLAAFYLLKDNGRFYMIHRPDRLVDILYSMRNLKIEPKSLRFVHPSPYKTATMVLVEGLKYGGEFLKMLPPLYIYDEEGNYSDEIDIIYSRDK